MNDTFDLDVVVRSLGYVLVDGLGFTLALTLTATVGGIALGIVLALMRQSSRFYISKPAQLYIDVARALPLILVIFWIYFLLPYVAQWVIGSARPVAVGARTSAFVTFTLFEAAYFAEIIRSGLRGIRKGQMDAGYSLGLNYWQVMGSITLPQAMRNMLPVLATQMIIMFQDSSLVYVLSLTDLLGAASKVAQRDGRLVEMYLFATLVYFLISFVASQLVQKLHMRVATPR
ncbi:glutamate/aspartate transport system permease protein [Variovorax sp. CF079]|uniref:amino acid ABC transporter permease n=1 Tax=Variovorax sp. CF079 TaxID=1882774 RepID=UPI000891BF3F|nr:amino acid ABC transporter permease [Variovorax sp. CF079]SDE96353.1 glutamate/aspartate transport system permease protein [Variovorax sp. CF079]